MALGFGTSGVRGLVTELTDRECALYTRAFIRYLRERNAAGTALSLAGDFRSSTPRILRAAAWAIGEEGLTADWCGFVPTPALALHALRRRQASLMVTGSHIPDDRNGIKFNLPWGEVLKADEARIAAWRTSVGNDLGADEALAAVFDPDGRLWVETPPFGSPDPRVESDYLQRYLDFFPRGCLAGRRVAVYEHSSVARELLVRLLEGLGAAVIRVGRSDRFIPVDTEAVEHADQLAGWVRAERVDALVSADGDGDRPLVVDERGGVVRGDLLGIIVAAYLRAEAVCAPVSCNTALEKCGLFRQITRTRIGSPYVVEAMQAAVASGSRRVVGFEANGGFLLASEVSGEIPGATLAALPTRDAALPILACLHAAARRAMTLSQLVATLPRRATCSNLLRPFPTAQGQALVARFKSGGMAEATRCFQGAFGSVTALDFTDGARITFENGDILHFRPSGNAPEFRVYTEAETETRAAANGERACALVRDLAAAIPAASTSHA